MKNNNLPGESIFLPVEPLILLERLAEKEHRAKEDQIIWMIESYASGRLKDMGDEPIHPKLTLTHPGKHSNSDFESVRVRAFRSSQPVADPKAGESASH